ncbi:hypothetical protein B0H94_10639 [Salsuginibacillus halophilus]|uniref:Uncharacterized protein n=1 Tax=Salsuginibacillus halophilus TaxID=517424 RepID=A0A2P8HHT1_9BACI|nr:hypothetical protein B0H94_10639 [Salsuginibacillus halophilus]
MNVTFTSDGRFPEGLASANLFERKPFEHVNLQPALDPPGVAVFRFVHFYIYGSESYPMYCIIWSCLKRL